MTEELVKILLENKDKNIKLSPNEIYGNHFHCYSHYSPDLLTRTIGCKEEFVFCNNGADDKYYFRLREYKYNTLYQYEHIVDSKHETIFTSYGESPIEYVNFRFIIEIYDNNNNKWFMYVKCKYVSTCNSCDGGTKYTNSRIVYSNDLRDLINFIYTPKETRRLLTEIKNSK
jgi:hypothetical protein